MGLLNNFQYLNKFRKLYPWHRTATTCCTRLHKGKNVPIVENEFGDISFSNIKFCQRHNVCKNCAEIVTYRRRLMIENMLERAREWGHSVIMVTWTIPHEKSTKYVHVRHNLTYLREKTKKGNAWTKLKNKYAFIGSINATETMLSYKNGWHIHYHELYIVKHSKMLGDKPLDRLMWCKNLQETISERYRKIAKKEGIPLPSKEHGINVIEIGDAGTYIQKWGVEFELTSSHLKKARSKDSFQMSYVLTQGVDHKDPKTDEEIFQKWIFDRGREYLNNSKPHSLVWSNNLKNYFEIPCDTDADFIKQSQNSYKKILATLDGLVFNQIRRDNKLGKLVDFLTLTKGFKKNHWINWYLEEYDTHPEFEFEENEREYFEYLSSKDDN